MKSKFLDQIYIFGMKLRFLEKNRNFQNEIEILRMKSRFLELIPDF